MRQSDALKKLNRNYRRFVEGMLKQAYADGFEAGVTRARGQGRRGRTVRDDATIEGLVRLIEQHFGLDRYSFEVRLVHPASGRRLPAADILRKHRAPVS
jgi:hypothetical protein